MWTTVDVLTALGAEGLAARCTPKLVRRACIDSRRIKCHDLFVALEGEHANGHDYVRDALRAGASIALVEREIEGVSSLAIDASLTERSTDSPEALVVTDTLEALQHYAAYLRRRCVDLKVIGVTGSVGKTTQKELLAAVLGQQFRTLKNFGNYNNEIGLPQTLTRLRLEHEIAVLEMGMYALGEIALLCDIARPQWGLVTNVGRTHLERLGTVERITQAKAELVRTLPNDGIAFLNGDDPRVRAMSSLTAASALYFGLSPDHNDVWADEISPLGVEGTRFRVHVQGLERFGIADENRTLRTSLLGKHAVRPALGGIIVGLCSGLSWDEIEAGLLAVGEGLRLLTKPGAGGCTLLDDTYNASPQSCRVALDFLASLSGRKIAVLGDMLELGDYERGGHERVGRYAVGRADYLIAVGARARAIASAALEAGLPSERCKRADDNGQAITLLREILRPGDRVLIKGSRGMAMEEIVVALERDDA